MYSDYYKRHTQTKPNTSNKCLQKQLNDSITDIRTPRTLDKSRMEASQIYNPRQTKPTKELKLDLGNNPFQESEGIKIKVFQTSTKANLDKKSYSQQHKQNLQKRLFNDNDSSILNCSFSKINTSGGFDSERQTYNSSQQRQSSTNSVTIRLTKQLDQRFYNFIKEYGMIVNESTDVPYSVTNSTERSRIASNDQRYTYYNCQNTPPPQKSSLRTKLFKHVN